MGLGKIKERTLARLHSITKSLRHIFDNYQPQTCIFALMIFHMNLGKNGNKIKK
jgi:Holliday junction resolvasome RuvABC endonuclease subunit